MNFTPENTAITRKTGSAPVKAAWKHYIGPIGSRVLDYGCGRGADVTWLRSKGYDACGYDPHPPFGFAAAPEGVFSTVMLTYVVNVLADVEARQKVVREAWDYVEPGGLLVIASRSRAEIDKRAKEKGWPAHGDGYWSHHSRGMFQRGHTASEIGKLCVDLPGALCRRGRGLGGSKLRTPGFTAWVAHRRHPEQEALGS